MNYAIIRVGGKQHKVSKGSVIDVNSLKAEDGKELIVEDVLMTVADDGKIKIGKPIVSGAKVKAKILKNFKGEKIRVAKFKAKARYRKVTGFRPHLTRLEIQDIIV